VLHCRGDRGTVESGAVIIDPSGQEILERTSVFISCEYDGSTIYHGASGVTIQTPNSGAVSRMGIPPYMALMVGGEHHGKPTLLMRALESGVYNHIPGGKKVGCIKSIRFKNQGG